MPKKRGKKYIEAAKKVEAAVAGNGNGGLEPEIACQIVRDTSISKFDATVEAHIRPVRQHDRPAPRRADGARVGRAAERDGQEGPRGRVRHRRQGTRGAGGGA